MPNSLVELVRSAFVYDADAGILRWAKDRGSRAKAGAVAGAESKHLGYWSVRVGGKLHYVHRLVWLMFNDELPEQIDHIDRNRGNNRIENLRAATNATNRQNMSIAKNNQSGVTGVYMCRGRWYAQIKLNRKNRFLGSFEDKESAIAARQAAKMRLHPFCVIHD